MVVLAVLVCLLGCHSSPSDSAASGAVAPGAAASGAVAPGAAAPLPADVVASLFLIGDTGEPDPKGEPALRRLGEQLHQTLRHQPAQQVRVIFLGDNIYPRGLPAPADDGYGQATGRLQQQLAIFDDLPVPYNVTDGPMAIFLAGNHDWGWSEHVQHLARQGRYLAEQSDGLAQLLPEHACPGPVSIELGDHLLLLILDTQWWLTFDKPLHGVHSPCTALTEQAVADQLQAALQSAGDRRVLVVGHHPLISGGPHNSWRGLGLIPQDLPGVAYQTMRKTLGNVFATRPELIYASGHDHSLQVLRGLGHAYQLVSGSGSQSKVSAVDRLSQTRFARSTSGFMRLQLTGDGRWWLDVFGIDESEPIFSDWLLSEP